jgi:hypothetical protein
VITKRHLLDLTESTTLDRLKIKICMVTSAFKVLIIAPTLSKTRTCQLLATIDRAGN